MTKKAPNALSKR